MVHQVKPVDVGPDNLLLAENAHQPQTVSFRFNDINFRQEQFLLTVFQNIGRSFTHFQPSDQEPSPMPPPWPSTTHMRRFLCTPRPPFFEMLTVSRNRPCLTCP